MKALKVKDHIERVHQFKKTKDTDAFYCEGKLKRSWGSHLVPQCSPSVPLFTYWSLTTLFYWTVKSLSY
ncbi:hypothetical protein T07_11803 [Trichinella nelsoni]|uniref:Uncharacterized protein n=1 Tax=Trichinella nelsoni TaxID=6336 RepID=A0A0V0RKQ1_9BILA|nr:hypothetical protein T07_11803 [Trichinella nelsoni]